MFGSKITLFTVDTSKTMCRTREIHNYHKYFHLVFPVFSRSLVKHPWFHHLTPRAGGGTGQRGGLLQDIAVKNQLRDGLALLCQENLIHLIYLQAVIMVIYHLSRETQLSLGPPDESGVYRSCGNTTKLSPKLLTCNDVY